MSIQNEIDRITAEVATQAELIARGIEILRTKTAGSGSSDTGGSSGADTALLNSLIDRSITEISSDAESIGDYAFRNCIALATMNFPQALSIGTYAFENCSQLTTADFPAVTSIGNFAFYKCSSLTTAYFPAATSIAGSAFGHCSSLTTAYFPAVTSITGSVFQHCSQLTTADFPALTSIGSYAFQYCSALTTADFPAVTSIGSYAFQYCSALTTADFPAVTSIDKYAFRNCTLIALILRSTTVATLSNTNAFTNTPIASGTGYIYVPSSLVDSYKSATNWSTYAAQIRAIEDYPDITGG